MDRISNALATLGGLGRARAAPGTLGSLVGLALAWGAASARPAAWTHALSLAAGSLVGVFVCGRFARAEGRADPPAAVADECLGMLWGLCGLPRHVGLWLLGFGLFRLFDITKPGPIRRCERLPGGWGIVADDVAAGLLTNACLRLFLWWHPLG